MQRARAERSLVPLLLLLGSCGTERACPNCDGPPVLTSRPEAGAGGGAGSGGLGGAGGESHQTLDGAFEETAEGEHCRRLLAACHEGFHLAWGEDHRVSALACQAHAAQLPRAGSAVTSGDFFECVEQWSRLAQENASLCPRALGAEVCVAQ